VDKAQTDLPPWKDAILDGFMSEIGPLLTRRDGDSRRFGLMAEDRHLNPNGTVHGGVFMTLLDHSLAFLAWQAAGKVPTVTVQMDTRFLDSAHAGEFLETTAKIVKESRSLIFLDAQVLCADRVMAQASAVMKVARKT
tara:strand:- start:7934 stop:8347 length:414 start_codon:yes stop_codon:yes gene_type:complete